MSPNPKYAGSRGSRLALWQTDFVIERLRRTSPETRWDRKIITTTGDRTTDRALPDFGGRGVFTSEIERALVRGEVDFAVHSLKDLPVEPAPGLAVAAVLGREHAGDVLVSRDGKTIDELGPGAVVGTSSIRRKAQLRARRDDLEIRSIRGNVETRISKVRSGEYDATILAAAGIERLGLAHEIAEKLDPGVMMPAPGQGAIAVQCRSDDEAMLAALGRINDAALLACVTAEREFLRALGGGCSAPVSAIAENTGGTGDVTIELRTRVSSPDGNFTIDGSLRGEGGGDGPIRLARELALAAIRRGADRVLAVAGRRVVVTRPAARAEDLTRRLEIAGFRPVSAPAIETAAVPYSIPGGVDAYDWIVFCSANAVSAFVDGVAEGMVDRGAGSSAGGTMRARRSAGSTVRGSGGSPRVAAVGPGTAAALRARGIDVDYTPAEHTAASLGRGLPKVSGTRILVPRSESGSDDVLRELAARGASVDPLTVYRTQSASLSDDAKTEIRSGVDAILFTSGSTVRGFLEATAALPSEIAALMKGVLVVCIGPKTGSEAARLGFRVDAVADDHSDAGIVETLVAAFQQRIPVREEMKS